MTEHPHLFKRLLKNNIFRLSVLYWLLFLIASISMLTMAYVSIEKNIQTSIEREINAEITRFIGNFQSNELGIITEPYAFFIEHDGQKIAGNLSEIPNQQSPRRRAKNLIEVDAKQFIGNQTLKTRGEIIGKTITLPNQTKLFIGKNNYDVTKRRGDIIDALTTALIFLLAFGLIGGLVISFQSIKRIDRISRVSKLINAGELHLRIPTTKHNDDIEEVSRNLNHMLDRIDGLMSGMREVTNNIAHDLRTPLTRLRTNIETISLKGKGEIREEAEKALAETDNLLNTFTSLLRISTVESGAGQLQKEDLNLSALTQEVMDFYDVLAEEKHQHLNLSIDKDIIVFADKSLLTQVIVNLFTNAVKYTPENGRIRLTLSAGKAAPFAELTVHDSGKGVPEEELDNITRRFYRLEKHRRVENGNGLGLSMVKAIVEAHQGKLIFENDVGLKAMVRLPLSSHKKTRQKAGKA